MDIEDTEIEIPDEEEMDFNDFDSYYCGESTTGAIPVIINVCHRYTKQLQCKDHN